MEFHLGETIGALRKAKGMTQEQFANRLGLTFQAVSKWENNASYPDITLLPQIADIFDVTIDALFGRQPIPSPEAKEVHLIADDLPWDDDDTVHAVLYWGRKLLQNQPVRFGVHRKGQALAEKDRIIFCYEGSTLLNIQSDFSVFCENCSVSGDVSAGDALTCGDVGGSAHAGDSLTCGNVKGNVTAGDSVHCQAVEGNVKAGDSVTCGNVGGNVDAGDGVKCGDVAGSVKAGDSVVCSGIGGSVDCDSIRIRKT